MVALLRSCENTEFMIGHFDQIYNEIVQVLKDKLPENLTYHNLAHTLYVLDKAMHIGRKEGVNGDDMYLLKIAALYHDSGFIVDPKNHEFHSCLLAKEYLEEYEYLEADLNPAERVPEKNPSASFLISMAATDPLKFESVITF